jgi:hypothetical protein
MGLITTRDFPRAVADRSESEWSRPKGHPEGCVNPYCPDLSWEVFHSFSSCLIMFTLFWLMLCEIKGITANYRQNDALDSRTWLMLYGIKVFYLFIGRMML